MWTEKSQTFKLDLEKAEELEMNCIHCIIKKEREFQENIYFCFTDYAKVFDCLDHNKLLREYQATLPASWETSMQVKK